MGLTISKSIVESHDRRIWANGDGGPGTTFHFTLPAAPRKQTLQWMLRDLAAAWVRGGVGVIVCGIANSLIDKRDRGKLPNLCMSYKWPHDLLARTSLGRDDRALADNRARSVLE